MLDAGRRIGRLVVEALAVSAGIGPGPDGSAVRALWEQVGVVVDPLSSAALILGIRCDGSHPLATMLATAADAGEPVVVTLSQLTRWAVPPARGDTVGLVVENPAVVNEAATTGSSVPKLCTGGWPSVAALTLLRPLLAAGIQVSTSTPNSTRRLWITSWLQNHLGTTPWLMTADAYRGALDLVPRQPTHRGRRSRHSLGPRPRRAHAPGTPRHPRGGDPPHLPRRHDRTIGATPGGLNLSARAGVGITGRAPRWE